MKDWVRKFLLSQVDDRISREEYLREISIPTLCFKRLARLFNFQMSERLLTLFGQTLSCIDEAAFLKLVSLPNLYFHNADKFGYLIQMRPLPDEPLTLIIFSGLEKLTDSCVVGVFAHEFAHAFLNHGDRAIVGLNIALEQEANEVVKGWGLDYELDKILEYLKTTRKEV